MSNSGHRDVIHERRKPISLAGTKKQKLAPSTTWSTQTLTKSRNPQEICAECGSDFLPPAPLDKISVALDTLNQVPLNALRLPPEGGTCGWYVWGGTHAPHGSRIFKPISVAQLIKQCPQIMPFLALAPGWKVLLASGQVELKPLHGFLSNTIAPSHAKATEYPLASPRQPSVAQFVLLSVLLHVLAIVLFGDTTGSASQRDHKTWGIFSATMQARLSEAGNQLKRDSDAPSSPRVSILPPSRSVTSSASTRSPGQVNIPAVPRRTDSTPNVPAAELPPIQENPAVEPATVSADEGRLTPQTLTPLASLPAPLVPAQVEWESLTPAPPISRLPPLASPPPLRPIVPIKPVEESLPPPRPAPLPRLQPLVPPPVLNPIEPAKVKEEFVPLLPPTVPPAPLTPLTPITPPITPAVPTMPTTPTAVAREPAAKESPSSTSSVAKTGVESDIFKPHRDAATPPANPGSTPRLDLGTLRQRAREIAREGSTGPRTLLPLPIAPKEKPKSKEELAFDKALKRPDCRDAYADMGLAAVVPLVWSAISDKGCKW